MWKKPTINKPNFNNNFSEISEKELNILWDKDTLNLNKDIIETLLEINNLSTESNKITINLMPIVTKINIKSLKKLVEFIGHEMCNCNISWQITQYTSIGKENIDNYLKVSQKEYILEVANSLKQAYSNYDDSIASKINAYSFSNSGKLLPPKVPKLLTCAPSFFIAANGDIYPCQGFEQDDLILGNINNNSLTELFYTDKFKNLINKTIINKIEPCLNCELRFVCTNKCNGCIKECQSDFQHCKETTIAKLYLQTQIIN